MTEKCFGPGNSLKKPLGLGRGVNITLYLDKEGYPVSVDCPWAIGYKFSENWQTVYCAATRPDAIRQFREGEDGSLADLDSCFKVHPRRAVR